MVIPMFEEKYILKYAFNDGEKKWWRAGLMRKGFSAHVPKIHLPVRPHPSDNHPMDQNSLVDLMHIFVRCTGYISVIRRMKYQANTYPSEHLALLQGLGHIAFCVQFPPILGRFWNLSEQVFSGFCFHFSHLFTIFNP